jgi:hypothetical protein
MGEIKSKAFSFIQQHTGSHMKILAIEKDVPGAVDDAYTPHLKAEALRAWELHQAGVIRELYFRAFVTS